MRDPRNGEVGNAHIDGRQLGGLRGFVALWERSLLPSRTYRTIALILLLGGLFVGFAPSVSAHDNGCTATVHAGPVKQHANCTGSDKSEKECLFSLKVALVKLEVNCN